MDRESHVYGLRILNVIPDNCSKNINIHSDIKIEFDADVNPGSIKGNFVVLEDPNRVYKNTSDLKDSSNFIQVKGNVGYSNKVLTFTPQEPLKIDTGYVVILNEDIKDIIGNQLTRTYISTFFTEMTASFKRVEFIAPKYGSICNNIPEFTWGNVGAPSYVFQVSKINTFETLIVDTFVVGNGTDKEISFKPDFFVSEGIYHVRVKAEDSAWSDITQFFIKPITDAVVANEDGIVDLTDFMSEIEEPIEILEFFPADGSILNSTKTNVIYIKVAGHLDESEVDFSRFFVTGAMFDEDDNADNEHGEVYGSWSLVYDSYFDETFLVFLMDSVDGTNSSTEYLETKEGNYLNANK